MALGPARSRGLDVICVFLVCLRFCFFVGFGVSGFCGVCVFVFSFWWVLLFFLGGVAAAPSARRPRSLVASGPGGLGAYM